MERQSSSIRAAAIEAERELVEVVVEMLALDAALMRAEQPAFQQRGDLVHARHDLVRGIGAGVDEADWCG